MRAKGDGVSRDSGGQRHRWKKRWVVIEEEQPDCGGRGGSEDVWVIAALAVGEGILVEKCGR